jgi:hypothetical protein
VKDLIQVIQDLPWPGLIPVVLLLVVGLVLWAAGRRVLKTGFAAAGLILGGVIGYAAGGLDALANMNIPAWVFGIVTAVVGAIIFAAAYRLVLAGAIAILLAALAPLGVWTAAELGVLPVGDQQVAQNPLFAEGNAPSDPETSSDLQEWIDGVMGDPDDEPAPPEEEAAADGDESVSETLLEWWGRANQILVSASATVWRETPASMRWTVVAAAAVGALLGLVFGAAAPSLSASIVTALGGSVIMLSSGLVLVTHVNIPYTDWMPTTATPLLIWWVVLAVIGLGVQWMLRARRADKPAS